MDEIRFQHHFQITWNNKAIQICATNFVRLKHYGTRTTSKERSETVKVNEYSLPQFSLSRHPFAALYWVMLIENLFSFLHTP